MGGVFNTVSTEFQVLTKSAEKGTKTKSRRLIDKETTTLLNRHFSRLQTFLRLTLESVPPPQTKLEGVRGVLFVVMWVLWGCFTTWEQKLNSVVASFIFSFVEFSWTFLAYGKPRTTFEQWYIITFYWSFLHEPYLYYMEQYGSILRFAFFPLLVWLTEIAEGYTLMFFHYGMNPAWCYKTSDALFHGNIRLFFLPHW